MPVLNVSNIIFLQLLLEVVLFILLMLIWRRTRRIPQQHNQPPRLPDEFAASMESFLAEADKISQSLTENLKDKKELSADLILKLDRRLSEYQALLKLTEASLEAAQKRAAELKNSLPQISKNSNSALRPEAKANPAAPEVRALVLQLARKGCSPEEIADRAKLRLGEVELIIDLERQFNF